MEPAHEADQGATDPAGPPPAETAAPPPQKLVPRAAGPRPVETIHKTAWRPKRNDPCWCGCGKKYKQCHMRNDGG
jgi:uncharacterized protein YecA (UPF0149 family)